MTDTTPHGLDVLTRRLQESGIRRPQAGRWAAGVCAGVAERQRIDPVLVRVLFLVLGLALGVGFVVYLWCWLLLPAEDGSVALERALRRGDGAAITLLVLTAIVTIGALTPSNAQNGPSALVLFLLVGGGLWWLTRTGRITLGDRGARPTGAPAPVVGGIDATGPVAATPDQGTFTGGSPHPGDVDAPTRPSPIPVVEPHAPQGVLHPASTAPSPSGGARPVPPARRRGSGFITLVAAGISILAYVGATLLVPPGIAARPWLIGMAAVLLVIGVTLVVTAITGHRPPLLRLSAWIVGISLVASVPSPGDTSEEVVWRPTTTTAIRGTYEMGVGVATLDLTAAPVDGVRDIEIDHGVGRLVVILPDTVSSTITLEKGPGDAELTDENGTRRLTDRFDGPTGPVTVGHGPLAYRIDIDAGVGDVQIRTAAPAPAPAPTTGGTR